MESVQLKKRRSAGFRIPHAGVVVKRKFPPDFLFFIITIFTYKSVFGSQ